MCCLSLTCLLALVPVDSCLSLWCGEGGLPVKTAKNSFTGNYRKHLACTLPLCDPFDILQKQDIVPSLRTPFALALYFRTYQRSPSATKGSRRRRSIKGVHLFIYLDVGHLKSLLLNSLQYRFCCLCLVLWLWSMWNLSSSTRNQTRTPCTGRQCLNHWAARKVPSSLHLLSACYLLLC